MENRLIATIFCLICVTITSAQEKLLSKQDAINLALENNFGIKVARNQVEIAKNNKSILNSGYLPTF